MTRGGLESAVTRRLRRFCSTSIWQGGKVKLMKKIKENSILWIEASGFSLLIALTWLTEIVGIPHLIFGEAFTPVWHRAVLRTLVILVVWTWVHQATKQLLKRLHYLEDFLRICSWCHRVDHDGEWLEIEKYFNSKFDMATTHGMCPDCLAKKLKEIAEAEYPPDAK